MNKRYYIFPLLLFCSNCTFAQTNDTISQCGNNYYWVSLGAGGSFIKNSALNLNFVGGFNYLIKNKYLLQLNYIGVANVTKAFVFNDYENNVDRLGSIVIAYGISKSVSRINSFNVSVGPSYTKGVYFGKDTASGDINWIVPFLAERKIEQETFESFGFFLSGQYLLRERFCGLGVRLYCNIHKHTDWGITVSLNLGILNKKEIVKD